MGRLERAAEGAAAELGRGELTVFNFSVGACSESGEHGAVVGGGEDRKGLARAVWVRAGIAGNVCRAETLSGHLLSGGQLDSIGNDGWEGPHGPAHAIFVESQDPVCLSAEARLPLSFV